MPPCHHAFPDSVRCLKCGEAARSRITVRAAIKPDGPMLAHSMISHAMQQANVSYTELARRMPIARPNLYRILAGKRDVRFQTLVKALAACGYELDVKLAQAPPSARPASV